MEALEFLKERKRMCRSCEKDRCGTTTYASDDDYKRTVAAVEQWAKEHPLKTRQSVFLEMFPNADVDATGVLFISPCKIDKTLHGPLCKPGCDGCRREFWMQEVE